MEKKRDLLIPLGLFLFLWVLPIMSLESQVVSRQKIDVAGQSVSVVVMKNQTLWYNDGNFAGARLRQKDGSIVAVRTFGAPRRGVFTVTKPASSAEVALYHRFF